MPIYSVEAPDGKIYDIEAPEGASEKSIFAFAQQAYLNNQPKEKPVELPPAPPATGLSSFVPAVKRGALGIRSLLGDVAPAMAGRVGEKLGIQGAGEYADRQMAEAAAEQQRIQQMYPSAVPSYTDIKSGGDALTYIVESVGELIPSILPSIFTGGAAGVVGRGAVVAAKQAAEKTAVAAAAKGLTEKEIKDLATKAGVEAAQKTALKYQAAGAVAGSAAQNVPEVYQNVAQETGVENLGVALVSGGFNSILDAITPLTLLRKAKGIGLTEKELIGAWYKRAGKGVLTGFATEGATEAVQEMSSAAAEKFVDNNKQFFTPQNFERFINAGLKGGIGGGAVSGVTNVAFGRKEEKAKPEVEEVKTEAGTTAPTTTPAEQGFINLEEARKQVKAKKIKEVPDGNRTDATAGGDGVAISGGPKASVPTTTVAGVDPNSVVDFGGATGAAADGKEKLPTSLISDEKIEDKKEELDAEASAAADAPFVQWLSDNGYGDKNLSAEELVTLRAQFNNQSKEVIKEDVVVEDTPEQKARFEAESTLVIPPGDKEVTTEITQPAPFMGEPVSGTERRFIEPKQTEEGLYPKAIQRRGELEALAVAAKEAEIPLAEKVKRSQSIEKVKEATSATINNDPAAKKLYKALKPEEKAQADAVIEKYKKLQENKAEPMRKRKEKQPPGVIYQPKDYKAQLKKEKAEAKKTTEAPPSPKKMSLLEERLADFRATKSQYKDAEGNISYYLEGLEDLRGGTTIGFMSNLMHGDLRGALQEIVKDTSGEFTKLDKIVAKRLLESDTLPTLRVVPSSEIDGKLGQYEAATDVAYVSEDAMTSHTVLHETLHGFTLAIIKAHEDGVKFNQGVANLKKLYEHLKETYPDLEGKYGMKNLAEFVSEAMSNPDFQEQLNSLPYERGNLIINGFVEFVKDILNLLGIGPGKDFTALAYALISTESILTEGRKLEATNPPPLTAALKSDAQIEKETLKPELRGYGSADDWLKATPGQPTPRTKQVRDAFTSVLGAKELARLFQNERYPIKTWEDLLAKANKIVYSGNSSTAIYSEISLSTGRAEDEFLVKMYNPSNALYKSIGEYSKARGIDEETALRELQIVFIAMHEKERRHVKYLMTVPLNADAALERDVILALVRSSKVDEATAAELRKDLDALVENNRMEKGYGQNSEQSNFPLDENSDYYNVAGIHPEIRDETLAKYYAPNKELIDNIKNSVQEVHKATIELNKKANYWSQPVSNIVSFYGFENYVPLKGRPDKKEAVIDDMLNFDGKYNGRELQEQEAAFDGRVSESNNPLLQTLSDGVRAALRAGRGGTHTNPDGTVEQYGITLAVKNAIDKKLLAGRPIAKIEFKDRYKVGEDSTLPVGENTFFHYNPDGSIEIYSIDDTKLREAVRRTYRTSQPLLDAANNITSLMGQMHTRYNVAFAPMNFIRDTLTNAFTMGAEMGVGTVGAVASKVAQGGLARAIRVANLYRKGSFAEIEKLGEKDPYIKAMYEYIQLGGKVSYVSGIGAESQFQQMQKNLGRKKIASAKADIDGVIDIWTNSFEFASRTAAYQVVKANYMNGSEQLSEREAAVKAAAYVKNLANFEQVGTWGKGLGAIFMFFRPSATGAVRAIEALVPLWRNVDNAIAGLPESVRNDPEAVAAFRDNMAKQRAAASRMLLALAGSGAAIYLMALTLAEDDEDGRNKVATDDLTRWTRYARFHIPGTDVIFQIPWGFGLGSFAAAGAQIMSFGLGNNSIGDTLSNVKTVGLDSFLPLPVSRINVWENPAAWAMDSATPSLFRPFFEYAMNMDGLGREIYNNRQTRSGDAYTGGDSIPELYKDAAKMLANATNGAVDWSPNTMYFFANNYADGLTRLIHNSYNIGMVGAGQKEFNPKTDTLAFDSFFGAKSNFDAREFSNIENQIKDKERRLNMFKNDPERYMEYIAANPLDQSIVDMYNKGINGDLKAARELANKYRAMPGLTPKERKELLDNIKEQQNLIKRNLISMFRSYEDFN